MNGMRPRLGALLLAVTLAAVPAMAHGQSLLVQVTDADSDRPVRGALLTLEDPTGTRTGSGLTSSSGRSLFEDLAPGRYVVTAELIGYTTGTREVTVALGEPALVEIALATRAIELEGIRVEAEGRCDVRPAAGLTVAEVWDEVRKALEAARWTDEKGVYQYRTRRYERSVDEETGRVSDERTRFGRAYQRTPYLSRPVEDLLENGFVQDPDDTPGGASYFAPDASVLLSDPFLDSHCMRLIIGEDDESGMVGLAFEPIRGRRVPDIAGTFWVDPVTWELGHLEFAYVGTRPDIETHGIGGEVRFQPLPDGTWIVSEWNIRTPLFALGRDGRGRETVYQYGYHDTGAVVLSVREPGGDALFTASTGALEGVVLAGGDGQPMPGATVALQGAGEQATSDADGAFRFTEIPAGEYRIGVAPPGTEGLEGNADVVPVEIVEGQVASVTLTAPDPFLLHAQACRRAGATMSDRTAVLVGRVTDRRSGEPLEAARVAIEWDDFGLVQSQGRVNAVGTSVTSGPQGHYRACAVPSDALLRVTAHWGGRETVQDTIRTPDAGPGLVHDITIRTSGGGADPPLQER